MVALLNATHAPPSVRSWVASACLAALRKNSALCSWQCHCCRLRPHLSVPVLGGSGCYLLGRRCAARQSSTSFLKAFAAALEDRGFRLNPRSPSTSWPNRRQGPRCWSSLQAGPTVETRVEQPFVPTSFDFGLGHSALSLPYWGSRALQSGLVPAQLSREDDVAEEMVALLLHTLPTQNTFLHRSPKRKEVEVFVIQSCTTPQGSVLLLSRLKRCATHFGPAPSKLLTTRKPLAKEAAVPYTSDPDFVHRSPLRKEVQVCVIRLCTLRSVHRLYRID